MRVPTLRFSSIALVFAFAANSALAATCTARETMARQLEAKFGETPHSVAPVSADAQLEIFATRDARTWSITVFLPDRGLSCLAATGKGQQSLNMALASN